MPRYTFENTKTGKTWVDFMMIAEMEELLEKNPHVRQVLFPLNIVSGVQGITHKTDQGFKDVYSKIAEAHPNSNFAKAHRRRSTKEIKTEQIRAKHRLINKKEHGVPD